MQSKIGYLLSGPLPSTHSANEAANFLTFSTSPLQEVDLQRFWSLKSMGMTPSTDDDPQNRFLKDYQRSSITHQPSGCYNAGFPWKKEHPLLPSNYSICENRTRFMAGRLSRTPEFLKTYGDILIMKIEVSLKGSILPKPQTMPTILLLRSRLLLQSELFLTAVAVRIQTRHH